MIDTFRYVAALAAVGLTSPALTQSNSRELVTRGHQVVEQMKSDDGRSAERKSDMMLRARLANGGTLPGAAGERSAELLDSTRHDDHATRR